VYLADILLKMNEMSILSQGYNSQYYFFDDYKNASKNFGKFVSANMT
jgi:hypothetical protein